MVFISRDNDLIVDYIRKYRETNDINIRNKLIEICYPSLKNLSRHFYLKLRYINFFDRDDYLSIIIETFMYMIDIFDEEKQCKFVTFFYRKSYFNIIDNIKKIQKYSKYSKNILSLDKKQIGINHTYMLKDYLIDNSINIEEQYIKKDNIDKIKEVYMKVYNKLKNATYKQVFILYYFKGLKACEINKILGKSPAYTNVILNKINKEYLQKELENYKNTLDKNII